MQAYADRPLCFIVGIQADTCSWIIKTQDEAAVLNSRLSAGYYRRGVANTQMSTMNDAEVAASRLMIMREQMERLLRNGWLPQLALAWTALAGALFLEQSYGPWALGLLSGGLACIAIGRWLAVRAYARFGEQVLGYHGWRALQLGSAVMTGVLAAILMQLFMAQVEDWQQMLLLALLASVVLSCWLASAGCLLSFLCYVSPVGAMALSVFFSSSSPALQSLSILFVGFIAVELVAALRLSVVYDRKMMLQQLLIQTRRQRDEEIHELQQVLGRLRTCEHALNLQINSLQSHLEHNSSEQTRSLSGTLDSLRTSEERLQRALEASGLALWDWNLVTGKVYHTGSEQLLGLKGEQASKLLADLRPLMHPDDLPVLREAMTAHMREETPDYSVEYRIRHADGHWIWIEDRGQAIARDAGGRVLRMLGTRRDITARRQHEEELQLASIVFETGSEGILVMDPSLNVLTVNTAFTRMTGFAREHMAPFQQHFQASLAGCGMESVMDVLKDEGSWHAELSGLSLAGSSFPMRVQLRAVYEQASGRLSHIVAFFSDLTPFREAQKRLDYLTRHDALTGLANRSLFMQYLQDASHQARFTDDDLALLHIDLDRFKLLNECFGSQTGDEVLRIVGRRLQRFANAERHLARLGGNEFVLVVSDLSNQQDIEQLAEDVLNALRTPFAIAGQELLLSASVGISLVGNEQCDAHILLNQAAVALNHAKYMGGNTWQLYREQMPVGDGERLQLEQQLRRGLKEGHVVAYYQPKLGLQDGRIYGVEALARWHHPERGMISPAEFIALAEQTGLIAELSESILRQACIQARQWMDAGNPLQVSVNLSVFHLRQGNVLALVQTVLEETGLPAYLLDLELTESQLLDDSEQLLQTFASLRELGVQISVDDFGTGYSSLGYLKQLPVNNLKIDRGFICDLPDSSPDAAITRAIISMAHGLNLKVVAEGVETLEQLDVLRGMGCDAVQGYLIARPMPAPELELLLQKQLQPLS